MTEFEFNGYEIRSVLVNDEPYFVGKDVANVLGYKNGARDITRYVDKEDRIKKQINNGSEYQNGIPIKNTGHSQATILINESGLYALIFSSHMKSAKKFTHWVTSEVLPSIRQHGAYLTNETVDRLLSDPYQLIELGQRLENEQLILEEDHTMYKKAPDGVRYVKVTLPDFVYNKLFKDKAENEKARLTKIVTDFIGSQE
ncbi:MAG: BRO family protein [Oenococcus sp.]|uniref:BRO-N domain-containing protein n=1 Tax=Oenococcus sp. TaxID=1979414 RepID=UPI0039ECD385